MEFLKKLLQLILDFLQVLQRKDSEKKVQVDTKNAVIQKIYAKKKEEVLKPKEKDFFNDDSW